MQISNTDVQKDGANKYWGALQYSRIIYLSFWH